MCHQGPALKNALELGGAEILAVGGHQRQRFQPIAHVGLGASHQAIVHQGQTAPQFGGLLDLHIQRMQLLRQHALGVQAHVLQQLTNVGQRQAHVPQRLNAMQPLHICRAVKAVARL